PDLAVQDVSGAPRVIPLDGQSGLVASDAAVVVVCSCVVHRPLPRLLDFLGAILVPDGPDTPEGRGPVPLNGPVFSLERARLVTRTGPSCRSSSPRVIRRSISCEKSGPFAVRTGRLNGLV